MTLNYLTNTDFKECIYKLKMSELDSYFENNKFKFFSKHLFRVYGTKKKTYCQKNIVRKKKQFKEMFNIFLRTKSFCLRQNIY